MSAEKELEWQAVRWPISLEKPPEVVHAGIRTHGLYGWESYHLPDLWCLHFYSYDAAVRLDTRRFPIRTGYVGIIPPDTRIEYEYQGRAQHLFVHFRAPLPDTGQEECCTHIPAMQDLGAEFSHLYEQLEEVIRSVGQPAYKTQARVWDVLCRLVDRAEAREQSRHTIHPAVEYAIGQIELRLGDPLSVAELAMEASISYSYLGRLFREALGVTVVEYIRTRRMHRAEHLLHHSTLPIKSIAASVGIPDLHFFNKVIRQNFGRSPRGLREG